MKIHHRKWRLQTSCVAILGALIAVGVDTGAQQGQVGVRDPGVRAGVVGAGKPLAGLSQQQLDVFNAGKEEFEALGSVQGKIAGEPDGGLGPRFNSNSCGSCHSQPAIGGSSPSPKHFPFVGPNAQVAVAKAQGATNVIPYFISADGPTREARFKRVVVNGALTNVEDGGVHALFTIAGRTDATNVIGVTGRFQTCRLAQPDFELMRRLDNIIFRTPTPVFGAGLIENIADRTILDNMAARSAEKTAFGIAGRPNRNGNDGTITKFGWKAQNASLVIFAGEAYNVEQGVSNELFPSERANPGDALPDECLFNGTPEDTINVTDPEESPHSDTVLFAAFMRFLAPPVPSATQPGGATSIQRGKVVFDEVAKCALCHTPSLKSSSSVPKRQSRRHHRPGATAGPPAATANLYSDLLLHDMGNQLADGIRQGVANGREFRTAPLWGLGQRVFFLHDGRTSDLVEAILAHGGTADKSVATFKGMPDQDQQHLLNFLRSL
jgi:CxxC motif-containing protein (DUF1111 family)